MDSNAASILQANVGKLPQQDQTFANSLLKQLNGSGKLSGNQWKWVGILAERAANPPAPLPQTEVGSFAGVVKLFDQAKKHLKFPKITLALPNGQPLQLSVAGHSSKHPGSINVTDGKPFGQNVWYGRVAANGTWTIGPKCQDEVVLDQVYDLLVKLSENPAGTAKAYGKLTGNCCFCLRGLTDERSILVGYGPVCAKRWGLPLGSC